MEWGISGGCLVETWFEAVVTAATGDGEATAGDRAEEAGATDALLLHAPKNITVMISMATDTHNANPFFIQVPPVYNCANSPEQQQNTS